jgi:Uma2 family endonuclease
MNQPAIQTRRWTRVEYERLVQAEVLDPDDHIELLGGALVVKEPQDSSHATGIRLAARALRRVFGPGWEVSVQLPVALDDESEPEPDISLVPGDARDYKDAHPSRPVLVLEVARSRIAFDREHRGSLYARAGIADYWIVNLPGRCLEVYRQPVADPGAPFGWRYGQLMVIGPEGSASPLAAGGASVPVADLLP